MKEKLYRYVDKPWGSETWVAVNEHYALKIIKLSKGSRTSLQYHNQKVEDIYLWSGLISAEEETADHQMVTTVYKPGEVMHNPTGFKHRLTALEDSTFVEVSTPFLDDVVRVADDYHRQ